MMVRPLANSETHRVLLKGTIEGKIGWGEPWTSDYWHVLSILLLMLVYVLAVKTGLLFKLAHLPYRPLCLVWVSY
jgi:hypothetical protein